MREYFPVRPVFCARIACVLHNHAAKDADKPCFVKMAQSKTLDSIAAKAVRVFQDGTRIFPGKIMDS